MMMIVTHLSILDRFAKSFDKACISKREKDKFFLLRKKFLMKFGSNKGFKEMVLNFVLILLI